MSSGFGQICPVAVACEVFAERWTPIILREMFAGSEHFNDIHRGQAGREFHSVIEGLGSWGQRWTVRVERDKLDPGFLMWN
jgi:DNA-binding HxlR family transcriptional regulator